MHQQITWHNASPEDGELARQREAIIRPLAAQPSLTPMVASETAGTLKPPAQPGLSPRRSIPEAPTDLNVAAWSERTPAGIAVPRSRLLSSWLHLGSQRRIH